MSLLQFVNNVGETLERGDVVVIAVRQTGIQDRPTVMPSLEVDFPQSAYDTTVCGVVSDLYAEHKPDSPADGKPESKEAARSGRGGRLRDQGKAGTGQAFTLAELENLDRSKIAPGQIGHIITGGLCLACKVDADISPIKAGDLLTTSATKGYAQKVTDRANAAGAVLGKALGALKKGKGTIPVLVTLQ